jgi:hypothetical protein
VRIVLEATASAVLAPVIGSVLLRADVQWHIAPGCADSLMRFWLTFAGGPTFGFHVGADGEMLDVIAEAPGTDADMGRFGRLEVRPATEPDPPARAVGRRLIEVRDLFQVYGVSAIGAHLSFESGASCGYSFSVADWEDELHWAVGDLPPDIEVQAEIRCVGDG